VTLHHGLQFIETREESCALRVDVRGEGIDLFNQALLHGVESLNFILRAALGFRNDGASTIGRRDLDMTRLRFRLALGFGHKRLRHLE
jgi:hypothetical protein